MSSSPVPRRVIAIAVLIPIGLGLLVSWFGWQAREPEPRDLPVVVVGPDAKDIAIQLTAGRTGAFAVTIMNSEAEADQALRDRRAYFAYIVTPDPGTGARNWMWLHVASAGSPAVAQLALTAFPLVGPDGPSLGGGSVFPVVDVVPGMADDPDGAGFASGFLPVVIASLVTGVLFGLLVSSWRIRLLGLILYAVVAGGVGSLVFAWLGLIPGSSFLACASALSLAALAISSAVTGLGSLLGRRGVALAVVVIFLLGIPISAVAIAPELLPEPWGTVGQLLPAGAGGTLLGSAAFFDWHGGNGPLWTLIAWAVGGLILVVVGRARLFGAPSRGTLRRVIAVAVLVPVGLGLVVSWFAWPARETKPRDVPIVVGAEPSEARSIASLIREGRPGMFSVTIVNSEAEAVQAVRDRRAYFAVVLTPGVGMSLYAASGAGPALAQLVHSVVPNATPSASPGSTPPLAVVDVFPGTVRDPQGTGFVAGFLPVVLASLVAGVLLASLVSSWRTRLVGLAVYAVVAGLVGSVALSLLGLVPGPNYLACASALSLAALAISSTVTGLGSLLGRPGVALAAVVIFVVGIPISAVAAAPELLPKPWGTVGQLLPPGAAGSLLRSAAFFEWHGAVNALWTLGVWAVGGLILVVVGRARLLGPTATSTTDETLGGWERSRPTTGAQLSGS